MEYKGYNGTVVVESDELTIRREGLSRAMSGGAATRRVPLSAISDVVIHHSSRLTNGWITLGMMGNSARLVGAGTAASDPDTVLFRHRDAEAFNALYEWLKSVVVANSSPSTQSASPSVPGLPEDRSDPYAPARLDGPTRLHDSSSIGPATPDDAVARSGPVGAWHPDPLGRFQYRYWDGAGWTDRVSTNGSREVDPLGTRAEPAASSAWATQSTRQDPPTADTATPSEPAPGFFQRRRENKSAKATARDAFEVLAMRAAHGDSTALSLLPAETRHARSLYGARDFDQRRFEVIASAVRAVIDDDVLTEPEEEHVAQLLRALEVDESQLWSNHVDLAEELAIASINAGRLPTVQNPQLILKAGEVCHGVFPASLMKDVAVRQYRGASSSVSIPLGAGMRYRVGGIRGHTVVVGTETVVADTGSLYVTSTRCLFSGRAKTLEFRHDRLVNLDQYRDGLRLSVSNRQTASLFRLTQGASPAVAAALISACARPGHG